MKRYIFLFLDLVFYRWEWTQVAVTATSLLYLHHYVFIFLYGYDWERSVVSNHNCICLFFSGFYSYIVGARGFFLFFLNFGTFYLRFHTFLPCSLILPRLFFFLIGSRTNFRILSRPLLRQHTLPRAECLVACAVIYPLLFTNFSSPHVLQTLFNLLF